MTDDETLGRIYVEDMELLEVPEDVLPYFDFEAYASHLQEHGKFLVTEHGIFELPE